MIKHIQRCFFQRSNNISVYESENPLSERVFCISDDFGAILASASYCCYFVDLALQQQISMYTSHNWDFG